MKINNGNHNTAKAYGYARLNGNEDKAREIKSKGAHVETSQFGKHDKTEFGGKNGTPVSAYGYANGKYSDLKGNFQHSPKSWYDHTHGKDLDQKRHVTQNSPHYYMHIKDLDKKKNLLQNPASPHGLINIRLLEKRKLILHNPIQLSKRFYIKGFDLKKLSPHNPIYANNRFYVKRFDLKKLSPHNPIYANNRLNTKHTVFNLSGFTLKALDHHTGKVSNSKPISANIYGLNEKTMASVLRLTELTMRIKVECYGNKLDYDAEYKKALKSWVGHFGGVYVPTKNHGDTGKAKTDHKHGGHHNSHWREGKFRVSNLAGFTLKSLPKINPFVIHNSLKAHGGARFTAKAPHYQN